MPNVITEHPSLDGLWGNDKAGFGGTPIPFASTGGIDFSGLPPPRARGGVPPLPGDPAYGTGWAETQPKLPPVVQPPTVEPPPISNVATPTPNAFGMSDLGTILSNLIAPLPTGNYGYGSTPNVGQNAISSGKNIRV